MIVPSRQIMLKFAYLATNPKGQPKIMRLACEEQLAISIDIAVYPGATRPFPRMVMQTAVPLGR